MGASIVVEAPPFTRLRSTYLSPLVHPRNDRRDDGGSNNRLSRGPEFVHPFLVLVQVLFGNAFIAFGQSLFEVLRRHWQVQLLSGNLLDLVGTQTCYFTSHRHHGGVSVNRFTEYYNDEKLFFFFSCKSYSNISTSRELTGWIEITWLWDHFNFHSTIFHEN